MSEPVLTLRLSGEKAADVATVGGVLSAFDGLYKAVAEEMGIAPDSARLAISSMRLVCDGCECTHEPGSAGWVKREGLDYCPVCLEKYEQRHVGEGR